MKKEKIMLIVSLIIMSISSIISVSAVTYLYNSSEVSYDNTNSGISATNVQGAINELYDTAQDYSSMNTRVTGLEGYFQNSPTSVFDTNYLHVSKNATGSNNNSYVTFYSNGVRKGAVGYDASDGRMQLAAINANGSWDKGDLRIRGQNINIGNDTNNASVNINGKKVALQEYLDSTGDLDTAFANQENQTVYFIGGQSEANQATSAGSIHFVISYRATSLWGFQWEFRGIDIYSRSMSNGTWGSWVKKVGS